MYIQRFYEFNNLTIYYSRNNRNKQKHKIFTAGRRGGAGVPLLLLFLLQLLLLPPARPRSARPPRPHHLTTARGRYTAADVTLWASASPTLWK